MSRAISSTLTLPFELSILLNGRSLTRFGAGNPKGALTTRRWPVSAPTPTPTSTRHFSVYSPPTLSQIPPESQSNESFTQPPKESTPPTHAVPPETLHAILSSALSSVPNNGWTHAALAHGCYSQSYPTTLASGVFPRGPIELVEFFMEESLKGTVRELDSMKEELGKMKVEERLKVGLEKRLEKTMGVAERWHEAMALLVLPINIQTSALHLGNLVNTIWNFAGDQSTSVSWYTKRAMLAAVYSSAELFMIEDTSSNFIETRGFLDRRLNDLDTLAKLRDETGSFMDFVARSLAGLAESVG